MQSQGMLDLHLKHTPSPTEPCRRQSSRAQQHTARRPHLRWEITSPARLHDGACDWTTRQTGECDKAEDHAHARAELTQVVRQCSQRDRKERLDSTGHEAVGERETIQRAMRVPDGGPTVQHQGHGGGGRDGRVQGPKEARCDESGKDASGDAEGVGEEEEVNGVQGCEGRVGVAVEINLVVITVRHRTENLERRGRHVRNKRQSTPPSRRERIQRKIRCRIVP